MLAGVGRDLGLGTPTGVDGLQRAAGMFAAVGTLGFFYPAQKLADVLGLRLRLIVQEELLLHALAIRRAALLLGASAQFSPLKSLPLPSPCWSEPGHRQTYQFPFRLRGQGLIHSQ